MPIKDKIRKSLWGKSGNRCSICKTELFASKNDIEEFNIGEECHIISCKENGPRYKEGLDNYDTFDNLILLCRNHHREIDELTDTYNEELLRYIKSNHENWVRKTISNAVNAEKENQPRFLARITSGKELFSIIAEVHGYRTDYEEIDNEEEAEYIAGVLQDLVDYGDLSGMVEAYDRVKMGFKLNGLLKRLEEKGYWLFGERGVEPVNFGSGKSDSWSVATLVIKKKDSSEILKVDLS